MDECARRRRALSQEFGECRDALAALGDETRQRIFVALLEGERTGMRVPELVARTHLSRPSVSHHLRILREAGLVGRHREGAKRYYRVNADERVWGRLKMLMEHLHTTVRIALASGYPGPEEEGELE